MRLIVLLLFLLFLGAGRATAQDSHYWNQQYGTRSTLLGGAVIGSVEDLSSTFYNPGALPLLENPDLILSANVYELTAISLESGTGMEEDLNSTNLRAAPDLIAGLIKLDVLGAKRLAYSLLTRQRFDLTLSARRTSDGSGDLPAGAAEALASQNLSEIWFGVTWARAVNEGFGIGVTGYVATRNQKTRYQVAAQALVDDAVGTLLFAEDFRYDSWSLLAKVGANWRGEGWTLGLTATTPRLQAYGSGDYFVDAARSRVVGADDFLAADNQEGADAQYKSPWSLGGGASKELGKATVNLSAEWFASVDAYDVIALEPVTAQSSGEVFNVIYGQQQASVLNGAIGLAYAFSPGTAGYLGLGTDFTANNTSPSENSAQVSRWDLYHLTAGGSFAISSVELTLGSTYSFGDSDTAVLANFGDLGNFQGGTEQILTRVKFRRLRFLLGFTVPI